MSRIRAIRTPNALTYQYFQRWIKIINYHQLAQVTRSRKLEELTFVGGGVRGASYVGVYKALYEEGLLDHVKTISGASAGALTAGLIATGVKPNRFQEISMNMDFESLLGERTWALAIERTGNPMLEFCRQMIQENIMRFFNENSNIWHSMKYSPRDYFYLKDLQERNNKHQAIYFRDLNRLQRLFPNRFKGLIMTTVDCATGKVKLFNTKTTPNVEIASAIRASASLPVILKPHEIDGRSYTDGGYYENIPTEASDEVYKELFNGNELNARVVEKKRLGRLVCAFSESENDPIYKALYSIEKQLYYPGRMGQFILDTLAKSICGIGSSKLCTEAAENSYQRLREKYALQTIKIDTNIGTTDFTKLENQKRQLYFRGYFPTKRYLINYDFIKEKPHFLLREFAFELYEEYETQYTWFSPFKTEPHKSRKAELLLSFCADSEKPLALKNIDQMIYNLAYLCMIDRRTNTLKPNTRSASLLIKHLNYPTTNLFIKTKFIALLENNSIDSIHSFKFSQEHLIKFINNCQIKEKPKSLFYDSFLDSNRQVKYNQLYNDSWMKND